MQDTSRRPSEADEDDWSQIANQTMRKRVQNRLAQRKHRSGIKARLAELERLAAQKDGPSQGMQQSMADTNLDAAMQSAGFPSNDNRNNNNTNSTNPLHLNRHIPSNSNSNSSYPAVTVSGGQGLNSGPVLPVLRDVPFGTNFSVPDHGDDGGLSPIFLEGYAHGADGIAQYLEQRRDAPDFHQHLQSFGGGVDHNVHADCVAASGNQLNLDSLTAHSLCSHGSSKCSRNPSLMGTASNSSTTSPSSRPSTNSTDFHPSQNSSTRRGTTKNQRHNSNASTARTVDSLSIDDDGSPETSAALSTRIAAAIKSIRLLGFSGIEELTAQFYTADLNDLPALADAQRASRRRELARMLSQIRENANDGWSDWETHGYREEIVHAAEEILSDECRRFLEEHENATGGKGAKSRQQLKRQFQDELPNLYGVLGVLCSSSKDWEETDHSAVIVNAINSILSGSARS